MALPVLPLNVETPITLVAGVVNNNQITLVAGKKYAWQFAASTTIDVNVFGPFVGVIDPTKTVGLGVLALAGSKVDVGNTIVKGGVYLVQVKSPITATVDLTVSDWTTWDTIFWQWVWKIFG